MLKKPEIIIFAGPNGSGKSTITAMTNIIEPYTNADNIKKSSHCSDMEAAILVDELRNKYIDEKISFTFETVLSTDRNLALLKRAKERGYFIRCIYVLTSEPLINVARVKARVQARGHDVPVEKIISRYYRASALLLELLPICDICHIYDNSEIPFRIFKKRKEQTLFWENEHWNLSKIELLTGTKLYFNETEQ